MWYGLAPFPWKKPLWLPQSCDSLICRCFFIFSSTKKGSNKAAAQSYVFFLIEAKALHSVYRAGYKMKVILIDTSNESNTREKHNNFYFPVG